MVSNTMIVGRPRGKAFFVLGMAMAAVVALAAAVSGCGQKGSLYLPTEAAARDRATLPQVLLPLRNASATFVPAVPAAPASATSAGR